MYRPKHIERKWIFQEGQVIPESLLKDLTYPDIILQTLFRRGHNTLSRINQFLDYRQYPPASPYELPDMERGINRILDAVESKQLIGVWGDFDVDGQTSTAILVSALRQVGANVTWHIPVRATESHGIGISALQRFIANGVKVILTCDTGSSANESIAYAQEKEIDVVVTDHHLLPTELPPAYALINPQRLPSTHPLATLPGAGTAYKFAEALLTNYSKVEAIPYLHDLAALGIIADLAELCGDARYLVQSGLARLRTSPRPSLLAMLQAAEVDPANVSEEHIAFNLAPRLNAVGRLSDANPMVSFLLSEKQEEIAVVVNQVEGLNARRKLLCDQVFTGALSMIEQERGLLDQSVLILKHADWPAGVVGIVASRLVEIYHRPVILLVGQPGQPLHGSARSVEGIDITAALRMNRSHLLSFGGHSMAAGLSLAEENLPTFQRGVNEVVKQSSFQRNEESVLLIDQPAYPVDISLELTRSLDILAPFGPGNPSLVFAAAGMQLIETSAVGKLGEHLSVEVEDPGGNRSRLIWWNGSGMPLPTGKFDLAYTTHATNYRGEDQVSFEWLDYRQLEEESSLEDGIHRSEIINYDFRNSSSPNRDLEELLANTKLQVWKEGNDDYSVPGKDRFALIHGTALVLWSAPPTFKVLRELLNTVRPNKVYWFLVPPHEHHIPLFLRQVGGRIKSGLQMGSTSFDLSSLAACTATSENIVELGVKWLASKGNVQIIEQTASGYILALGGTPHPDAQKMIEQSLKHSFQEMQSFSQYLGRTDLVKITEELR